MRRSACERSVSLCCGNYVLPLPLTILGVDFTSAPSRRKQITVAVASLQGPYLRFARIDRLTDFGAFEMMLEAPGPWVAGFDFPFGLPRELALALGWPTSWTELVKHVRKIGKPAFVGALDQLRQSRPYGARYIARRGDAAAGSSSPMKLVNPPVGLMFLEGAPRLLQAGLSILPCAPSNDSRVAVEAYPGFLVRKITRTSYKKDGLEGMTPARRTARVLLLNVLRSASDNVCDFVVQLSDELALECIEDGSGDAIDAVICAVQAAQSSRLGTSFGMPSRADPLEGWIATVPDS